MTSPLCAAEIRAVHGKVLVNAGTGFRAIESTTALKVGDAAIAEPHGLGRVTHGDGCAVDVVPGSVVWIREYSPCAAAPGLLPSRDPDPIVTPGVVFDPAWLVDGVATLDPRKPPAGQ
jgi:hypothetical protein